LRKEINAISETLMRIFAVTDELIFQDAKKDTTAKEAYKSVINMNEVKTKESKERKKKHKQSNTHAHIYNTYTIEIQIINKQSGGNRTNAKFFP
jgi:hypothetical protein